MFNKKPQPRRVGFPYSTGNQLPTGGSVLTGGFAFSWKSNPSGGFEVQRKTDPNRTERSFPCSTENPNHAEWVFHAQQETNFQQVVLRSQEVLHSAGNPTQVEASRFNEKPNLKWWSFPRSTENRPELRGLSTFSEKPPHHRRFNQTGRRQTGESASSVLWTECAKSPRPFSGRPSS